jgi:hypothetical protein
MGAPLVSFNATDDSAFAVKVPVNQAWNDCAIPERTGQIMNTANPALAQAAWPLAGGRRRTARKQRGRRAAASHRRRTMRGGAFFNGYGLNPAVSVGGEGPNVGALVAPVPCDARAGTFQRGGSYGTGNAYAADCYKAPGSSLPVYPAETAGFTFRPSTEVGGTLPDGVTAYMNVTPYAARMGGSRRRRTQRRRKSIRRRRAHRRA